MRKLIYILLIGVFIACSEEETLTPMEVKNWLLLLRKIWTKWMI